MSDLPGPRTIAARALLTRAPGGRQTMRGVAVAELSKLLARVEQEATADYRAELEWVVDELDRCAARLAAHDAAAPAPTADQLDHRGRIRQLLSRPDRGGSKARGTGAGWSGVPAARADPTVRHPQDLPSGS